jgi:TonB family protein
VLGVWVSRDQTWRWWLVAAAWAHFAVIGVLAQFPLAPVPAEPAVVAPPPIELVRFVRSDLGARREPAEVIRPAPAARLSPREVAGEPAASPIPDPEPVAAAPLPPAFVDPVDRLRDALGWGPIDRAMLAEERVEVGPTGTAPPIAPDLPSAWEPAAGLTGTPLGRYIGGLEDSVMGRWRRLELSVADRARGVSGRVGVRYRVAPDGRTSAVHVSSSSGYAPLDALALEAIPRRVAPFPPELARSTPIWHEVVLRYRNPYVATGL